MDFGPQNGQWHWCWLFCMHDPQVYHPVLFIHVLNSFIRSFVHSITTFSLTVYFSIFRLCECHVWIFSISVFNVFLFISFVAFLSKSYDSNFTNISCMSVTNTCRQHQIRAFHFRFGFAVIRRTKYTDTIRSRKIRRNNVTPSSEQNITMLQHRWNTQQMKNVTNLIWLSIDWLVLNVFWYTKREIQGERNPAIAIRYCQLECMLSKLVVWNEHLKVLLWRWRAFFVQQQRNE